MADRIPHPALGPASARTQDGRALFRAAETAQEIRDDITRRLDRADRPRAGSAAERTSS